MYAKLEEDFGLAKKSMAIFDRAAQAVADDDKFEVRISFSGAMLQRLIAFEDVHHLYCESHSQLRSTGQSSDL